MRARGRRWLALSVTVVSALVLVPATPALAYYAVTDVAPAATSSGNRTMILATANPTTPGYNWILHNVWDLGSSGVWQVEDTESCATTVSPATALVSNGTYAFLMVRGPDGTVCLNQGGLEPPGKYLYLWDWVGWQRIGVSTNVAPALASSGNRTLALITATDGRLLYDWWDLGGGAHGFREVPGGLRTTTTAAAALVSNGGYVFIIARGLNGQLYLTQGGPGGSFIGWYPMNLATNTAPAAAASGNRSVVLVTATDGRILYDWWDLGGGGHGLREVPGGFRTDAAPAGALVGGGNYLFVAAKNTGAAARVYLNQGNLGGSFVGWTGL
jgi:hypothetical protein